MIRVDQRLRSSDLPARLLLSVHDELLLEVPREEVDAVAGLVRETMEGALPLEVPLVVDVKVGDDWESMTPLTRADAIAAEADEVDELESPVAPILS
jgi:DNA polymerase-1